MPGSTWVRRQVVEHMPGPLSPLFDALYLADGLERGFTRMLHEMRIDLDEVIPRPFFATVNGFAYSRGDVDLALRTVPTLLRAYVVGARYISREALPQWREQALPSYQQVVDRWRDQDPEALADQELLDGVRELARADAEYWCAVSVVVGAAKVSDAVLQGVLRRLLRDPSAGSGRFLRGFPSRTLAGDAALEALADHAREAGDLRAAVLETDPARWPDALVGVPGGAEWLQALEGYFRQYGHQIYSLDFAEPVPADDRMPVLDNLQQRVAGAHRDVPGLQAAIARDRDEAVRRTASGLDPVRRRAFLAALRWAQRYAPGREEALFYLGLGWPVLRRLAAELGRRLVAAGAAENPDDVYELLPEEIEAAVSGRASGDLARRAVNRRLLRERRRQLRPPVVVPPTGRMRIGGIDMSAWESAKRNTEDAEVLSGFPVSPGRVTAPASVILGPQQFADMTPGSILVCPMTSPAWTPLFAQARGLVTDIGGVLAHGSIVAREYGIPAVMGTGIATQCIRSGQIITIDGDAGVVGLADQPA